MKTIFHHRVEITDGTGIIRHADGYQVSEVAVVAENENQIVVDIRGRFVVVSKKKSKYDTGIDSESIGIDTRDSVWGNRVTYTLYSYKKKRAASIRKAIEAEINRLWALYHHQGGSSAVGQPIRAALGIGEHDHLTPSQVYEACDAAANAKAKAEATDA